MCLCAILAALFCVVFNSHPKGQPSHFGWPFEWTVVPVVPSDEGAAYVWAEAHVGPIRLLADVAVGSCIGGMLGLVIGRTRR